MDISDVRRVVDVWAAQYQELGAIEWINYVQIFENRGAMMGASNPHPHCQIWANATVPNEPAKELHAQREYRERYGQCLLCTYLNLEMESRERTILSNGDFAVAVPFWAVWPLEVIVISRRHIANMNELTGQERGSLAEILKITTAGFDQVFQTPFPYSMGFHQSPPDQQEHPEWHFHAHFYPPLLRSATVRKFMVGYELLAAPQRDITPEQATAILRRAVGVGAQ